MAEETKEIKIETTTTRKLPSIKNGVWLASVKEESQDMNWFKHCGYGKINATRTTLLAIQAYTMVKGHIPSFVCHYGLAYNGGSTHGLHEITKVIENDMHIDNILQCPEDEIPGKLGNDKGLSCATADSCTEIFIADCQDHSAYAIGKMCAEMKIDFRCFKFLSPHRPFAQDKNADHYRQIKNKLWIEDCKKGAEAMRKMCESRFGDVPNAT